MPAANRAFIVAGIGLFVSLLLAVLLGQGASSLAIGVVVICGLLFVYAVFLRHIRVEALILGFLIFGYIVANRGFAQLGLGGPLFLGEVGLAACLLMVALRFALTRQSPIPPTLLGRSIVIMLVLGLIRLYLDIHLHVNNVPVMYALRDFAAVYYALFFFVAYSVGQHQPSRLFLERCVFAACLALLPIAATDVFFPDLLWRITVRGNPLFYQKGDLITAFLALSAFYLFHYAGPGRLRRWLRPISIFGTIGMLLFSERAGWVGFILAALLLVCAGQWRFITYQVVLLMVAAVCYLAVNALELQQGHGVVADFADRVQSMTDFSGTGKYRDETGEAKAANNQFRLVWWKNVWNDTMDKGPWFGLGFGYDLAESFVREYYANQGEFTTRSPHSIWLTMLGRMGIIGFLCFTLIVFLICRCAYLFARGYDDSPGQNSILSLWCAVLILFGAATFGVVLEGPMGAVPFWGFLGLAVSRPSGRRERDLEPEHPIEEDNWVAPELAGTRVAD
jgi:hypothetical protein